MSGRTGAIVPEKARLDKFGPAIPDLPPQRHRDHRERIQIFPSLGILFKTRTLQLTVNRNLKLPLKAHTSQTQPTAEALLINRLQQPDPIAQCTSPSPSPQRQELNLTANP